jgi:type IV pilus assembly protein PilW
MSFAPASIRATEARSVPHPACDTGRREHGISLVELMIGMTIGMIALLVMVQTFSVSSGHKDNTVSGADATTAGHIALTLIERDLLNAGSGFAITKCTEIRQRNSDGSFQKFSYPVTIEASTTAGTYNNRSDRITMRYSDSAEAAATSIIKQSMPDPATTMFGTSLHGFADNDFILLYAPGQPCVVLRLTDRPKWSNDKAHFAVATRDFYNAIKKDDFYPSGVFLEGVGRLLSLGQGGVTNAEYSLTYRSTSGSVPNSDLQVKNGTRTDTLSRDVIALRAQYGWWDSATNTVSFSSSIKAGADPMQLAAVRVGIVVRASQRDRSYTAPSSIKLFAFDDPITITLAGDELNYRYRTFETVVPLRNTIWNR